MELNPDTTSQRGSTRTLSNREGIMRRVRLGVVAVDSGQLVVMDPGYVDSCWRPGDDSGQYGGGTYEECAELVLSQRQGGQVCFLNGRPGLGVVFASGWGDGTYEVFAHIDDMLEGGRTVKVEIVLIAEESILGDRGECAEECA